MTSRASAYPMWLDLWEGLRDRLGMSPKVAWHHDGEMIVASVGGQEIALPSESRLWRYEKGIRRRCDRIARAYGVGRFVDMPRGGNIIDIGANVAEFSMGLAPVSAKVLTIEPDPLCFACVARNVAPFANIIPVHSLLWHEATELEFHTAPEKADSSIFGADGGQSTGVIRMPATTVDILAEIHGFDRVDLIKCDAEGAEPEVLLGASETLKRTRAVTVDTGAERQGARTDARVEEILRENGFEVAQVMSRARELTIGTRR